MATKFNVKHQGKDINHPPSINDLWVTFLGQPFALPFPWASQKSIYDELMIWSTSLLSNIIGFCKTSFRIELITNPINLLSMKFWIPISFKIQKGHRAPWFHCGCEDKENRRWDSCRWGRHRRLWGYDGWEMLHWAETKVHHKICQGKGYIQHADEMHVCVCVIMIIKITSLHNFSSYLHQCKTNTCIPYPI